MLDMEIINNYQSIIQEGKEPTIHDVPLQVVLETVVSIIVVLALFSIVYTCIVTIVYYSKAK